MTTFGTFVTCNRDGDTYRRYPALGIDIQVKTVDAIQHMMHTGYSMLGAHQLTSSQRNDTGSTMYMFIKNGSAPGPSDPSQPGVMIVQAQNDLKVYNTTQNKWTNPRWDSSPYDPNNFVDGVLSTLYNQGGYKIMHVAIGCGDMTFTLCKA